jgi:hypothetical protein
MFELFREQEGPGNNPGSVVTQMATRPNHGLGRSR